MEIKVYTPELNLIGIIENFRSLLWNRKYSTAGSFELHAPASPYIINLLTRGNIVSYRGAAEAGVVESVLIEMSSNKNEITAKGRFLSSYMDRRLIRPKYNFSGKVETAMRTILSNAVAIPLVILGMEQGYTETITFQATYKNLLTYENKLADSIGAGFRFRPDFTAKTITFEIYKGLDHSVRQSDRTRVVFSEDFNNINNAKYSENDQLYKTVAYVGGQGEGDNRTWVTVGDDAGTGLERREVALSASDVSPDDLTTTEYQNKLKQRGEDLLNKDVISASFECTTIPDGNFEYQKHYDLGDIVTVRKADWGIDADLRLKEITEVYEHGKRTLSPVFGDALPLTIDWEDR